MLTVTTMEDQLISFDTAKLAKEKGFNIPCINYWDESHKESIQTFTELINFRKNIGAFNAPTQSVLQKWLREKHNIHVESHMYIKEPDALYAYKYQIKDTDNYKLNILIQKNNYSTYEKSLEDGLQEALKLLII